ncbi:uncharacterized protein LOC111244333 isoform X3 [Varroa destructor]|uniref:Uncharacterized protein n=1 Tax=Varroa destructor TaxID=109461 RepID=A0A7M7JJ53_VARDE|nr:uncharacterized protein LOC111244333 isoform X3 [Varroa destructor]
MTDNVDQDHLQTRNNLMRRFVVRALLELDAEVADGSDERSRLDTFKAATLLKLFPIRGSFHDLVPFDNDFYIKHVVPKIEKRLAYELKPLAEVDLVTDQTVAEKYSELYDKLKALADQYKRLLSNVGNSQQLLQDVLRHQQWALRQKLAQAEVDRLALTSVIFDKKLIKINRDIYNIFCSYKFDEAVKVVEDQINRDIQALQEEIAARTKKHEVYQKARKVSPEIDVLLERYESTVTSINQLRAYQLEEN